MRKIHWLIAAAALAMSVPAVGSADDLTNPMGEHVMTGTITKLDKTTGRVSIQTAEAPLELHFPAPTLEHLKQGDKVAVELAISTDVSAAAAETEHSGLGHTHGAGTGSASPQY